MIMSQGKEAVSAKQKLMKAWSGAMGGVVFWIILGIFLFDWAWWIFFLIAMTVLNPIQLSFRYFAEESKLCPVCQERLDLSSKFCRRCGTQLILQCPSCQMKILSSARFCEKCGKPLYSNISNTNTNSILNTKINANSISNIPPKNISSDPALNFNEKSDSNVPSIDTPRFCPMCGYQIESNTTECPNCTSKI
jgi:hypothetical protein